MEKFYLEEPSIERKKDALDYLQEFVDYNSHINGTGGMNRCLKGTTYEEWLDNLYKMKEKDYADSKGLVAGSTYFMIRESDNKIVGMFNIRHYLNEDLKKYGGHIGYGIRPTERRKGYAKIQLYLALLESQKLGIDKVLIQCVDTNIGSEKTIQALGGVFENEFYYEEKNEQVHSYWIDVNESIEKYKDIYKKYLLN